MSENQIYYELVRIPSDISKETMDWSDYFSDQFGESSKLVELNGEETPASKIFKSIVDLWLEFATFEISLRQFKVSN